MDSSFGEQRRAWQCGAYPVSEPCGAATGQGGDPRPGEVLRKGSGRVARRPKESSPVETKPDDPLHTRWSPTARHLGASALIQVEKLLASKSITVGGNLVALILDGGMRFTVWAQARYSHGQLDIVRAYIVSRQVGRDLRVAAVKAGRKAGTPASLETLIVAYRKDSAGGRRDLRLRIRRLPSRPSGGFSRLEHLEALPGGKVASPWHGW